MKIGVIGSSHSACIRAGWDLVKGDLGERLAPEFFSIGHNYFSLFREDESGIFRVSSGSENEQNLARMQARAINGSGEFSLSHFDAICVVGPFTGIDAVARLLVQVTISDREDIETGSKTLISPHTLKGIMADLQREAITRWPLGARKEQYHFAVPSPFPFEKFLRREVGGILGEKTHKALVSDPNFSRTVLNYIASLRAIFSDQLSVTLLRQSSDTISEYPIVSSDTYCKGAMRLGGQEQPREDFSHANAEYGALFWKDFVKALPSLVER